MGLPALLISVHPVPLSSSWPGSAGLSLSHTDCNLDLATKTTPSQQVAVKTGVRIRSDPFTAAAASQTPRRRAADGALAAIMRRLCQIAAYSAQVGVATATRRLTWEGTQLPTWGHVEGGGQRLRQGVQQFTASCRAMNTLSQNEERGDH